MLTRTSFAARNLRRRPLRTGILVLSIGLLVSVLVFGLSFTQRVDSGIKRTSERLGADLLIVPTGARGFAEDILLENRVKTVYMDGSVLQRIRQVEGIEKVTPQTYLVTLSGLCCDVPDATIVAFNQESDFVVRPWLKEDVRGKLKPGEAIAGKESAFNIGVGLMEVDGVLFGKTFRIVGTLEKTGTGLDNAIFITDQNMEDILQKGKSEVKPGQISILFAKVKPGIDPYKVASRIEDTIIEVDVVARKDIGKGLLNNLRDIRTIFAVGVVLATLLSMILTWSVFSAIANERSREVGIMRALGARESYVARVFLTEVVIVGIAGSIVGIIFGTGLSVLLATSFSMLRNIPSDLVPLERVVVALVGLMGGLIVCAVGALSPLWALMKMEPLSAIKGE